MANETAIKFDKDKIRFELLPSDVLEEVAKVFTFGATKYGDRNWEKGFNYTRIIGSLLRHVFAWTKGEDQDQESGLSHMAHAICCAMFLLAFKIRKTGVDDRCQEVSTQLPTPRIGEALQRPAPSAESTVGSPPSASTTLNEMVSTIIADNVLTTKPLRCVQQREVKKDGGPSIVRSFKVFPPNSDFGRKS